MLILALTTDKLQLVTDTTATLDVHVSFQDLSGTTVTPGKQNTAISTATTTDILASPGASTYRNAKTINIRNKHATITASPILVFDANSTDYELHKATLLPGEALEYVEGIGFFTLTSAPKVNVFKRVTSNVVNATTSFADITDLTQALLSGKKYAVQACLFHVGNATTTGASFGYNIGAAPTVSLFGNLQPTTNAVVTGVIACGTITARDTAITASTTSTTGNATTWIGGYIQPSADGTFAMRCASEIAVAAGVTVLAGSWMQVRELDN